MGKPKKPKHQLYRGEIVNFHVPHFEEAGERLAASKALIEKVGAEIRANPNSDGWIRLCEILKSAKEDNRIQSSAGASDFLGLMLEIARDSLTAPSAYIALKPLAAIFKSDDSEAQLQNLAKARKTAGANKSEKATKYHAAWRVWAKETWQQNPFWNLSKVAEHVLEIAIRNDHRLANGKVYEVGTIENKIKGVLKSMRAA